MYGLLLESIAQYVTRVYGADKWEDIRRKAKIDKSNFNIHQVYAETLIPRLVDSSHHVLNVPREVLLNGFGESFVSFVAQYGYDQILKVLGRHVRDFLNGLDNLHEYLKFSYPKLKPPSFYCEKETAGGLILHYRSSRRYNGYMHYVSGQIKSVGRHIYKTEIQVEVLKEELVRNSVHVVFQLRFNNEGFVEAQRTQKRLADSNRSAKLQVESRLFFDVFPFHLAFDEEMSIISVGRSLETIFPNLVGYDITHIFTVQRPKVDFGYQAILMHLNNAFEIVSIDPVVAGEGGQVVTAAGGKQPGGNAAANAANAANANGDNLDDLDANGEPTEGGKGGGKHGGSGGGGGGGKHRRSSSIISDSNDEEAGHFLHLKGQMLHVVSSKCFLFLCTPILHDLKRMSETGLFICDMSLHDNSRELVLAGTQQSLELKLAVEQEKTKTRKLEMLGQQLDKERRKNEELLFNYIPKPLIEQLRRGVSTQELCKIIDNAVVVMCQLSNMDKLASAEGGGAAGVVGMDGGQDDNGGFVEGSSNAVYNSLSKLNMFYSKSEQISTKHHCYKLETSSENFVVIAGTVVNASNISSGMSGSNENQDSTTNNLITMQNAIAMADELAVCVVKQMGLSIRLAVCSGSVVAGVLGVKVPRYCAFGKPLMMAEIMATSTPEYTCTMDEQCYQVTRALALNAQSATTTSTSTPQQSQGHDGRQQQVQTKRLQLFDIKNARSKTIAFKGAQIPAYELQFGETKKLQM